MKAMILAAGRGERMRPLTDDVPKPLLRAGGRRLIEYHLEALRAACVRRVVINHAHLGEEIERALGTGAAYGLEIVYSAEPEALETGGGIRQALAQLGPDPFLVVNGDVWTDYPFTRLPAEPAGLAHLVLVPSPAHHPQGDFTLIEDRVGIEGEARLTFSGIALYRPELLGGLAPGRFPLGPVLRKAAQAGEVSGERYDGAWFDIGTPQRLAALEAYLSSGRAPAARGTG